MALLFKPSRFSFRGRISPGHAALALCLTLASLATPAMASGTDAKASTRDAARIFFSGHSLTDNPLPEDLAAIAKSLGGSAQ